MKRVRGGLNAMPDPSDDVIIVDDDDVVASSSKSAATAALRAKAVMRLDHAKVLSSFRLKPQKVGLVFLAYIH